MQVKLYRHINGLDFDNPEKIVVFPSKENYAQNYATYISQAAYWTGEGKTYNIEGQEVCDIDISIYNNSSNYKPVYLSVEEADGLIKYYYIFEIQLLPQKARLLLVADTFATYYERAQLSPVLVTKSTRRINQNSMITIPDELQEIAPNNLTRNVLQGFSGANLVFVVKIKYQRARTSNTQAYVTGLFYVKCSDDDASLAVDKVFRTYNNICNAFEHSESAAGTDLPIEVQEIYLLPKTYVNPGVDEDNDLFIDLHYVTATGGLAYIRAHQIEKFADDTELNIYPTFAGYSKIVIGTNEVKLPNIIEWGNATPRGILSFAFDYSDFDVLLTVGTNEPVSIKDYFKCEVANSTQETSLQKIARNANLVLNVLSTAGSAALTVATGGTFGATSAIRSATSIVQQEARGVIDRATKSQLPSTRFTSTGFSVFFKPNGQFRAGFIFHDFYYSTSPVSQGVYEILHNGVAWFNYIDTLENIKDFPFIANPMAANVRRNYLEAVVEITNIPVAAAQEIQNLLSSGVTVITRSAV